MWRNLREGGERERPVRQCEKADEGSQSPAERGDPKDRSGRNSNTLKAGAVGLCEPLAASERLICRKVECSLVGLGFWGVLEKEEEAVRNGTNTAPLGGGLA
jgi:hypothetical protein